MYLKICVQESNLYYLFRTVPDQILRCQTSHRNALFSYAQLGCIFLHLLHYKKTREQSEL